MAGQRQVGAFMDAKPSAVDLTGQEYHFCLLDGNGEVALPALGGPATGVIQEGKVVGLSSSYATGGQLKVVAAVAINEGDEITTAADGRARVAAVGQEILGYAMSPAAADELTTVNFNPKGLKAA